ncbi:acyl-CoA dehydrogenase family protein [Aquisalimonas sp.]|uniref:acyl-CoA dehydrogenase family protein n=2 Tax=Aquisalimonas TaxID=406099 RepID=UPI0025BBFAED|nr:acyl-CoA dehydrogenase family protein [Aquisalimonas sp.]
MAATAQTLPHTPGLAPGLEPDHALESRVAGLVRDQLAPQTVAIDRQGVYPSGFMHELGALGGYSQHIPSRRDNAGHDFPMAIQLMETVSRECMSTGFCVWCQDALAWYLENADNPEAKQTLLPRIASGELLGGTGLSNGMKHLADIEALKIRVRPVEGGYIANGTLPWVSNLAAEHAFAAIFQVEDSDRKVMAVTFCDQPGFSLQQCAEFTALEGSGTYACHFRDAFIPDAHVITHDISGFIPRIRSGFVLLQMGMGLGVVQGCIDIMQEMAATHAHVNRYLDDQPAALTDALDDARNATRALGREIGDPSDELFADVLQLRHTASELSLRASQAAMLHAGARGYLANAPGQRKLRESYFVAIVTPAIKHLRKELERLGAH